MPAAWASSSMNDWNTNENALLRGARIAHVGTPVGISDAWNSKFGRNVPGNSFDGMFAEGANVLALAEAHEVIAPGDEFAGSVQSALQVMEAAGR